MTGHWASAFQERASAARIPPMASEKETDDRCNFMTLSLRGEGGQQDGGRRGVVRDDAVEEHVLRARARGPLEIEAHLQSAGASRSRREAFVPPSRRVAG